MNIEKLRETLNFFYDNNEIGISIYAILKGKDSETPKTLDLNNEDLKPLKKLFLNDLKEKITDNQELSLMPISSTDERKNVIYEYDLEVPQGLSSLEEVSNSDSTDRFNFTSDDFSKIKTLLIEIGNDEHQLVLYKTIAPVNIFGRKQFFLKKSNRRFEKIDDDFIRINSGFQIMKIDSSLFVLNLEVLEKLFGFHDIIKREAINSLNAINETQLLDNPESLNELIDDVAFARKLTKVAKHSPVLKGNIPNGEIVKFTMSHPALKDRIKHNSHKNKLILDTKISKNLFVKLLNDDFLTSELTKHYYDSLAKDDISLKSQ